MAVGIALNVTLARHGLRIGATGAIGVDAQQRTSIPNVYAVGDCCEVYHRVSGRWAYLPLGDTANKQAAWRAGPSAAAPPRTRASSGPSPSRSSSSKRRRRA